MTVAQASGPAEASPIVLILFGLAFAAMGLFWAYWLSRGRQGLAWRLAFPAWPRWQRGFTMKMLVVCVYTGLFLALLGVVEGLVAVGRAVF